MYISVSMVFNTYGISYRYRACDFSLCVFTGFTELLYNSEKLCLVSQGNEDGSSPGLGGWGFGWVDLIPEEFD